MLTGMKGTMNIPSGKKKSVSVKPPYSNNLIFQLISPSPLALNTSTSASDISWSSGGNPVVKNLAASLSELSGLSLFTVVNRASTSANASLINSKNGGVQFSLENNGRLYINNQLLVTVSHTGDLYECLSYLYNKGQGYGYRNGQLVATGNISATSIPSYSGDGDIGTLSWYLSSYNWAGKIKAILIYNYCLNETERMLVEKCLKQLFDL